MGSNTHGRPDSDPYGFVAFLDSLAKDQSVSRVPTVFRPEEKLGERLLNEFTEIEYLPHGLAQKILGGHRPPLQLGVRNCRGAL